MKRALSAALQAHLAQARTPLIIGCILFCVLIAIVFAYYQLSAQRAAGKAGVASVSLRAAALALILLACHVMYLDSRVLSAFEDIPMGRHGPPMALKALAVAGGLPTLPSFSGGFMYAFITLGVALWVGARSETQFGERAIAPLRGVARVGWVLCGLMAALDLWVLASFWAIIASAGKP